jgi:DUF3040 family protein
VLSDHERETLKEIEQQLRTDDVTFARLLAATPEKAAAHRRRWVLTSLIVFWSVLTIVSVVVGAAESALACMAVLGGLAAAWHWFDQLRSPGQEAQ